MQEELLETNPDADVAVYAVWEPMLGGRRTNALEATGLLPDPRVRHFWNEDFIVGNHYSEAAFGRTAWDIYFLYGPDAVWEERPEPLISSGFTVIGQRRQLQEDFSAILERIPQ